MKKIISLTTLLFISTGCSMIPLKERRSPLVSLHEVQRNLKEEGKQKLKDCDKLASGDYPRLYACIDKVVETQEQLNSELDELEDLFKEFRSLAKDPQTNRERILQIISLSNEIVDELPDDKAQSIRPVLNMMNIAAYAVES